VVAALSALRDLAYEGLMCWPGERRSAQPALSRHLGHWGRKLAPCVPPRPEPDDSGDRCLPALTVASRQSDW